MVTTDPYDYQYVNKGFYILRPKKEESYMVTKSNLWEVLDIDTDIKPEFYPFVLSTVGDKMRSLPKVKGFGSKTTVKAIRQAIDKNLISDTTTSISMLIRLIKEEFTDTVLKNYQCIDLDTQLGYIHLSSKMALTKQLVDRFDNIGLKEITNQYFQEYPINIHEITDANRLLLGKRII
jgi:5'-3' exonuclease